MPSRRDLLRNFAGAAVVGTSSLSWSTLSLAAAKPNVIAAVGADVVVLDPHRLAGGVDFFVAANVFEGLYGHDEKGQLGPVLAESVKMSEDGLTYSFTLRKAKFHDGSPVTSDDVVFSWKRNVAPETRSNFANIVVRNIETIDVKDDLHFDVKLKKRDISFLHNTGQYWYIVPKRYIESVGDEAFGRKPVGTGPFKFIDRRIKEFIKLQGFDEHWGRAPKIAELTMKIVPDDQARIAQILSGEADLVTNVAPVIARHIERQPNVQIISAPCLWFSFITVNTLTNPMLAKVDVRRALSMAIDKDALVKTLMLGYAQRADLLCRPGAVGCTTSSEPDPYDPKRARELLQQAGFDFSKPLKFVALASGRVPQSKEAVEGVASMLRQIGVQTDITTLEYGAWLATFGAKDKGPGVDIMFGTSSDFNGGDPSGRLIRTLRTGGTYSWYANPELDAMLDQVNASADADKHREALTKIYNFVHDNVPLVPLWSPDLVYAASKKISWKPTPYHAWPIFWNIEKSA